MEGLWILVGIVGVIIVLIILDKIINSGYEKELVETLDVPIDSDLFTLQT